MSCGSCPAGNGAAKRTNPTMMIQLVPGSLKKPEWLKMKVGLPNERFTRLRGMAKDLKLATVCQEAMCPNMSECWGGGTATFMIMGDTCTRACRFCSVNHGKPQALDPDEPKKLSGVIGTMELDYVVITCVDRDDLPDGGSTHFAECIKQLRADHPKLLIEILASDFAGALNETQRLIDSGPHVYAHNIETVERLTPSVRDHRAGYRQSLSVLEYIKKNTPTMFTKSSIMLGLGETDEEMTQTMKDLRSVGVDFLTIGQYLRGTSWNLPVKEFVRPSVFKKYEEEGLALGFKYVASGPFVRSSYKAGEFYIKSVLEKAGQPNG